MELNLSQINFAYGQQKVLHDVNFSLHEGEISLLLGPNGAGKTTLLKSIMGLIPYSGTMGAFDMNGKTLSRSAYSYLCQLNKTSSYLTVIEVVLLGLVHELNWKISSEQETKAEAVLQELNLIHLGILLLFHLTELQLVYILFYELIQLHSGMLSLQNFFYPYV